MMKRSRIFFLLSACLLAVLSISCITEVEKGASLGVGDSLPEFSVEMSDGAVVSNVSLMGNVSVIMFFLKLILILEITARGYTRRVLVGFIPVLAIILDSV